MTTTHECHDNYDKEVNKLEPKLPHEIMAEEAFRQFAPNKEMPDNYQDIFDVLSQMEHPSSGVKNYPLMKRMMRIKEQHAIDSHAEERRKNQEKEVYQETIDSLDRELEECINGAEQLEAPLDTGV